MMNSEIESKGRIRWAFGLGVCLTAVAILLWLWGFSGREGQSKVMLTGLTFILSSLALLIWLHFFSGASKGAKARVWGVVILAIFLFIALFRYRGLTGDFAPVFEPRWATAGRSFSAKAAGDLDQPFHFPQFLGPSRNGVLSGVRLAPDWETSPPVLMWRRPMGTGWSGFAVMGNRAVTQEQRDGNERVVCHDLQTGQLLWTSDSSAGYESAIAGDGPRATPTIVADRVFALGTNGLLRCLDLESGRTLWSQDTLTDNGAGLPQWGKSCSPLAWKHLIVVSAGGPAGRSLVAYEQASGRMAWHGGDDPSGYSSPAGMTLSGVEQIVIFNSNSVTAHSPENGQVLWRFDWPSRQPNVMQPLPVSENRLLVSSGYGVGSKLLQIDPGSGSTKMDASLIWESNRLKAKFTNLVLYQGLVYGLDDGILVCLDPATGQRKWKRGRYGHGQVLLVEDLLLIQTEAGEIVLAAPNPEKLTELSRFRVMDGKLWNPPTLVGRYLIVRNEREAALFELPVLSTSGD